MTSTNIPKAVKTQARELLKRTGWKKYADAVAVAMRTDPPRQPRARWQLSDDLRDWLHGEGWRGAWFGDLYEWVDTLKTRFECDWCYEDCDAEREDASLELVIGGYDPDLSPATMPLNTHKYHARCKPSRVVFAEKVPTWDGPHVIGVPASMKPEMVGEFRLTVTPFDSEDAPFADAPPVLIVVAELVEGHGEDAAAWHYELEDAVRQLGFWELDSEPLGERPDIALRIVTGEHPWMALRTSPVKTGRTPDHLFVGQPALGSDDPANFRLAMLPEQYEQWARRAVEYGAVLVALGPMAQSGRVDRFDLEALDSEEIEEALFEPFGEHRFLFHLAHVVDPENPTLTLSTGKAFGHEDGQEWTIRATNAADAPVDGDAR